MKLAVELELYRLQAGQFASPARAPYGAFNMPGPCGERLLIIASDGKDEDGDHAWEHVSVSTKRRIPNWIEMCFVKKLCWAPEDCVVQFHPPESAYINNHRNVLHMWRWTRGEFPRPPDWMVGDKALGELK